MRDLIILAIVYASLPVILFRPFYGLMVYAWISYMRPQDMAWAGSRQASLAEYVAIALFLGIALAMGRERPLSWKPQTVLLILLVAWISVSAYNALDPQLASVAYGHYWKAILIAVLMTGMIRTRERAQWLLVLVAFSVGFLGAKFGIFGLLRGGTRFDNGPGGMMSDNNHFAVGLIMALPLLVGIVMVDRRKWLRAAALAAALLSIFTVFFTFSRGGLLTLAVAGTLLVWRSQRRVLALAVVALGVGGFLTLTSDAVVEGYVGRAETITSYEEDGSAMGRINAWKTAWRVSQDYPLYGVGPENFSVVFHRYSPDPDRFRVAHNAYLQLLSECGWPALVLFLTLLGVTIWRLEGLKRRATEPWVEVYSRMLQVSVVAYMTGSLFLNLAYFELTFGLIGLATGLEVAAELEGAAERTARKARRDPGELPWWKRPPAGLPAPAARVGAASRGSL